MSNLCIAVIRKIKARNTSNVRHMYFELEHKGHWSQICVVTPASQLSCWVGNSTDRLHGVGLPLLHASTSSVTSTLGVQKLNALLFMRMLWSRSYKTKQIHWFSERTFLHQGFPGCASRNPRGPRQFLRAIAWCIVVCFLNKKHLCLKRKQKGQNCRCVDKKGVWAERR